MTHDCGCKILFEGERGRHTGGYYIQYCETHAKAFQYREALEYLANGGANDFAGNPSLWSSQIAKKALEEKSKPETETCLVDPKYTGSGLCDCHKPKDEVEEKINEMMMVGKCDGFKYAVFENDLRKFVALARKEKQNG